MDDSEQFEDELDAAREAVKRLGGAKRVGPQIWPDKTPEGSSRYLHDCLNPARAERLSPSQLLLLMRLAREIGFHGLTAYLLQEAGYAPPVPLNPQTEAEMLVQHMDSLVERLGPLLGRLERVRGLKTD